MSASRTAGRLLHVYPASWRERYGEELEDLIVASAAGAKVPWRVRLDVLRGGVRERQSAAGLRGDGSPRERVRSGVLLVLWAWGLVAVGALFVQRFAGPLPAVLQFDAHGVVPAANDALIVASLCAAVLVLVGACAVLPALRRFLAAGGWATIRRRVVAAGVLTGFAVAVAVVLTIWADRLNPLERYRLGPYVVAYLAWGGLVIACALTWTLVAISIARLLELGERTLRLETWLAVGATAAMGLVTASAAVWWIAFAQAGWLLLWPMAIGMAFLVPASALAAVGSTWAVRARTPGADGRPA